MLGSCSSCGAPLCVYLGRCSCELRLSCSWTWLCRCDKWVVGVLEQLGGNAQLVKGLICALPEIQGCVCLSCRQRQLEPALQRFLGGEEELNLFSKLFYKIWEVLCCRGLSWELVQYFSKHKEHTHWLYIDLLICEFMEQNLKCDLVAETSGISGCCKSSLSSEIIPSTSENSESPQNWRCREWNLLLMRNCYYLNFTTASVGLLPYGPSVISSLMKWLVHLGSRI